MIAVELVSWQDALIHLSAIARASIPANDKLRVLEAGCGRQWALKVDPDACVITGVDNDPTALQARVEEYGDIHQPIEGDVQDPEIVEKGAFDLVYSAFVLEHLPDAEAAAHSWIDWLDDHGTLVLIVPDASSVYGFLSSHTPHWFHVWFYRRILGRALAGTPGHAPYPVSYSRLLTVGGLSRFAEEHGLEMDYMCAIGNMRPDVTSADKLKNRMLRLAKQALHLVSGGRLMWRHDNLAAVMKKGTLDRRPNAKSDDARPVDPS